MLNQQFAKGIVAALLYTDVFLSGHNFEGLKELARAISSAAEHDG